MKQVTVFDTDVIFKPFAILWFLSIEIQFYISLMHFNFDTLFFKENKLIFIVIFFL